VPTPADQLPSDITTLARKIQTLENEVRELRAARRLESATVGAGGLGIAEGGRFFMRTPDGVRMVDTGAINNGAYNNPDGSQQLANFLKRQNGQLALSVFASPGSGATQFWALWDDAGNIIVSDDAVTGQGLGRPYMPVEMWPAFEAGWDYWPRTVSATMQELWGGQIYSQQPRIAVVVRASTDTSGTTGQLQLTINGVAQGSAQNVAFSVGLISLGPFSLADFGHMDQVAIAVTGKRTAGTGALRATVYSAYTLQS
jgi:hypothetical protein